uniref:Gem-associated protein 8 n=1 Tax=Arion vulgaris TaxID=1028688 RepID=A0A0B6ZYV1_9EUPU
MAEKGQTSSMTSVTEEDISAGSESDTTESSYSNVTSSLLSSTDTDDKLTPSLIKISISNTASAASRSSEHKKPQLARAEKTGKHHDALHEHKLQKDIKDFDEKHTSGNGVLLTNTDIPATNFVHPYGANPIPLKFARKEQKLRSDCSSHQIFNHCLIQPCVKHKLGGCEENLGMDDADNKLSTDCSDTSSRQRFGDRNNNNEFDVDSNEDNDVESVESEQERPFLPDLSSDRWHQAQCFDRYWSHYRFVMQWYNLHVHAVTALQTQMVGTWGYPQQWPFSQKPWQSQRENVGRTRQSKKSSRQRKSRRRSRRRSDSASYSTAEQNGVTRMRTKALVPRHSKKQSHKEEDGEELEMEITDDMLEFFTTSFKHKLERDKPGETDPISSAPTERPGVRRTVEMKELYGTGAPMIQAMETAMQMSFDRFLDRFQPSPWPNMPLKISFTK